MLDLQEQLAQLRKRVARIDRKYSSFPQMNVPSAENPQQAYERRLSSPRFFIEEWAQGTVTENEHGAHFQMEKLYERHRRHGSADVGALAELPHTLLNCLSEGEIASSPPEQWAFLDTETTGLAGGSGTYAFLIGVGRITNRGFHVRQFFMREYAEERSLLTALSAYLQQFDVLITYNGKTYDQPLLETRYRLNRQKPPFAQLRHLDLLHGARRLWKLRLQNCRLMQLEQQILGFERQGDLPGELIPYVYFEYLRRGEAQRLIPIFHHNALDILTLGCLTGIVPSAFQSTDPETLRELGVRRGEELLGLGRWLLTTGEHERGLAMLKRAVDANLPDALLFRTLWDIARLEKKLERFHAALPLFTEIAGCRNPYRVDALEELAKYYEHTERNPALALEFIHQALVYEDREQFRRRKSRLERKLAKPKSRRLL